MQVLYLHYDKFEVKVLQLSDFE